MCPPNEESSFYLRRQFRVRGLDKTIVLIQEDGAEEVDLFDGVASFFNVDTVAHVVWMLDEQEDDARQDLFK